MVELLLGFFLGFAACMGLLYYIGNKKHEGHGGLKKSSGPSSRNVMHENVVSIVKKG